MLVHCNVVNKQLPSLAHTQPAAPLMQLVFGSPGVGDGVRDVVKPTGVGCGVGATVWPGGAGVGNGVGCGVGAGVSCIWQRLRA